MEVILNEQSVHSRRRYFFMLQKQLIFISRL